MRLRTLVLPAVLAALLAGCGAEGLSVDPKYGVKPSPRVASGEKISKGGGRYHVGKPYKIAGRWYHPKEDPNYRGRGKASWYGEAFHGRLTANGEVFDMNGLSAAHPTLPLPSYVRVTNRQNGHSVVVRVNDRGPFHGGRVIDVSKKAAEILGFKKAGIGDVSVAYVDKADLDGRDDWLITTASIQGERMSARQLAALGVGERALRVAATTAPRATTPAAPAPVQVAVEQFEPVAAPIQNAYVSEPTDVLVGAFGDAANAQYVAGVLGQFGTVDMQPITFGGQLLQHMTVRTTDPGLAQAALDMAHGLGATDARILSR